jgi:hypothetical protein
MNQIEQIITDLNVKYLKQVKSILLKNSYIFTNFREATPKEDMENGFDAVISFPDVKIPIRIRQNKYLQYMDLTIRSESRYGAKTEIHKIKEGFGDYYFYAWANQNNNSIISYMILDLNVFRQTIIDQPIIYNMANPDGTKFHIYSRELLIKNRIIKIIENF